MERLHKLLPLFTRQARQPFTDHMIAQLCCPAALTQIDEAVTQRIPGQRFMLQHRHGGTVNNHIVLGMLQQHTHHGRLGDKRMELSRHPGKAIRFQNRTVEAGAVVIISRQQAIRLQI